MNIIRFSDLCAQGRVRGQRVFIRADLNVPLDDQGGIAEDTRIRASVPCIQMALDAGAAVKPEDSLAPVAARLASLLGRDVPLLSDWIDGVQVQPGQVVLLENCRVNVGEKKNAEPLARRLAALCDIFVNDAFGTAHRAEGTTYGIAQFAPIACAGPLLAAEIDAITQALAKPRRPLVAIVAGSKASTKLTTDRGRRYCQHLYAGCRPAHWQEPGRAQFSGGGARSDRGNEGAWRRSADSHGCGDGQSLCCGCSRSRQSRCRCGRRRFDPRYWP